MSFHGQFHTEGERVANHEADHAKRIPGHPPEEDPCFYSFGLVTAPLVSNYFLVWFECD
jgi:hypothetical protein